MIDNEKINDNLTIHSGCLAIAQKTLSIFFKNIFKLLLLLAFYLAITLPQEHFHFNFVDSFFDSSFLQKDIIDILQIIIESQNIFLLQNFISLGFPAILFLIITIIKLMICLSFIKIIHEDSNIVFAFLYELKETIFFVIDRTIAIIIIYAPSTLLFFLIYKKYGHIAEILARVPEFIWLVFLAAALILAHFANRFGAYIYNTICEKIKYTGPQSTQAYLLLKLYAKGNWLAIIGKIFAIATLVFLFQTLIWLIPFPTTPIFYDLSIDDLVKINLDFFYTEFYIVSFYIIYHIYRDSFEQGFKRTQEKLLQN